MRIKITEIYKSMAIAIIYVLAAGLLGGCSKSFDSDYYTNLQSHQNTSATSRIPVPDTRHTLIMFSLGHNNLATSLRDDIEEIKQGYIPGFYRTDDVLLVFSHNSAHKGSWRAPVQPTLTRIYKRASGQIVTDTLKIWDETTISTSPTLIKEVFELARTHYPSASYGALFSSHGTGYVPAGFYAHPEKYVYQEKQNTGKQYINNIWRPTPQPYSDNTHSDGILVKSFGQDVQNNLSYELEIIDLAEAIPYKLSYILFDACLMGGIEVAYELKDKCDKIGFSQAEVLADGFVYTSLGEHLLKGKQYPERICEDYFKLYDLQSGIFRSATISCIDCTKLSKMSEICRRLFSKYRSQLNSLSPYEIQRYYRYNYHWYYDLESIVNKLGATSEEIKEFKESLDACTIYKGATPSFLRDSGGFDIEIFSGLSMYLPSDGHRELNKFYHNLAWNKATNLIL